MKFGINKGFNGKNRESPELSEVKISRSSQEKRVFKLCCTLLFSELCKMDTFCFSLGFNLS